jgi:hypothetical protein
MENSRLFVLPNFLASLCNPSAFCQFFKTKNFALKWMLMKALG